MHKPALFPDLDKVTKDSPTTVAEGTYTGTYSIRLPDETIATIRVAMRTAWAPDGQTVELVVSSDRELHDLRVAVAFADEPQDIRRSGCRNCVEARIDHRRNPIHGRLPKRCVLGGWRFQLRGHEEDVYGDEVRICPV
ncbi:MAG TPA: hypothetical protein VEA69_22395 [Tepidisphaeraceae bacterium]|nr:hypothetical protein [Tepidisphaeraceae bacterium]